MVFARRQIASLQEAGAITRSFFLGGRTSPLLLFQEAKRFRREITTFKPDLIHAHFGTITGFFCAMITSLPLVVTFRGSDLNPSPSMTWLRSATGRVLSQVAALRATQIICVSDQLKGRLWWQRNRTTVIPTGVDTDSFYPISRDEARNKLRWAKEEKIILFNAGREPMVKRLDLAQAAVTVAETLCGNIRCVVLDGHVEPKVVPTMMNAADCLLLTSDWEGSPTVVQEAIACDLPVVSVDAGDVRERLADVEPSRIVSRDPKEIGRALAEIVLEGKRSNGHRMVQNLSLNTIANDILSVYRAAIEDE